MSAADFLIFFGPAIALLVIGLLGMERGFSGAGLVGVVLAGTVAWLAYAAAVAHTANGQTVFGTTPRYEDGDAIVMLPFATMLLIAAVAGWRRVAAAFTIGAAVIAGPLGLAFWTTPQGDGDGLWALIFVMLPVFGGVCAVVATVARAIGNRSDTDPRMSMTSSRVAGLVVDVVIFGAVTYRPLATLSSRGGDAVTLILGVAIAAAYLAVPIAIGGATLGQRLLGLRVVDAASGAAPSLVQSIGRSVIIVAELLVAMVLVGLTFIPELISVASGNASFADALCRTRVVRRTLRSVQD